MLDIFYIHVLIRTDGAAELYGFPFRITDAVVVVVAVTTVQY